LFQARWTDAIHDEWIGGLLRDRPELAVKLVRTRECMNDAVRDCLVEDYEHLIPMLVLPDPDDRHVLAAAIRARAETIVTFNLKHFPAATLAGYGIEAQHPDDFVVDLLDRDEAAVCGAVRDQRRLLRSPPMSAGEVLDTLARVGLKQTASRLRDFSDLL
jgi:hypothetical protein